MPITVKPAMQSQKEHAAVELWYSAAASHNRAFAKDSFRLPFDTLRTNGSMALYLHCVVIFALGGENHHTKEENLQRSS